MQVTKVPYDSLEYHHIYKRYLKKCPELLIWPGMENLTPKANASLQTVQPVSVITDTVERHFLIAGIRTYLAAAKDPPKEIIAIVYSDNELSSKAVHEIICADFYLSLLPHVVGKGGMAQLIAASQLLPPRILSKWFQFPETRKHILSKILPVSDTHVKKVLTNDTLKF